MLLTATDRLGRKGSSVIERIAGKTGDQEKIPAAFRLIPQKHWQCPPIETSIVQKDQLLMDRKT
jgi:hypothetical protein